MGWFSRWTPLESGLIDVYTQTFQAEGKSVAEATTMAEQLLLKSKQIVKERGLQDARPNFGDYLLSIEHSVPEVAARLSWVRAEGATDEDIRQWNNLHALERVMIEQADELARTVMYVTLRKAGIPAEAAAKRVFQFHAKFEGDDSGPVDDRPLPYELKFRILTFTESSYAAAASFRAQAEASSSFNAVIRRAIREKRL